jgi:hypothetical protein
MAILHPENFDLLRQDAGLYRELDLMERLEQYLPANYEVFHSVSWFSVINSHDHHGEIDVVVMSPEGNILLVEVKAGDVILRDGEIFKVYNGNESSVSRQCNMQYTSMVRRLSDAKLRTFVTNCLVLPDYKITGANLIGFPRERIIGTEDYDSVGTRIIEILRSAPERENDVDTIRRFLKNEFRVTPDLNVLKGQISTASRKLSDGMSLWVPRITSPSGVIRIQGTAGSGKTQLALQLLSDAVINKQKSLYVCFNRSLADHMRKIAPTSVLVTNFHELCVDHYRRVVNNPNFSDPDIFAKAANSYIEYASLQEPRYDLIILDEGQDLEPEWVTCLVEQLKSDGRLYLMEDQDQRLYARDEYDLDGAVLVSSYENYRSPQAICQMINAFGLASKSIQPKGPYKGEFPDFHVYRNDAELISMTASAVDSLIHRGFNLADIVILTGRGRVKSKLLNVDHIGKFSTRHFTGNYTPDGDQIWSAGDLTIESVYRFKGQSSPAVVLSEVDFVDMNEVERNKLFVGLTRAQMVVEIVLSPTADECLHKMLSVL